MEIGLIKRKEKEEEKDKELKVEQLDEKGIRRIIKFEEKGSEETEGQQKREVEEKKKEEVKKEQEGIDQKVIMQSLKEFDFQIKRNKEEIERLNRKLEEISRDLDDLVSLYEIVSEQMNPFVGLSKVTKQRLEALENYTKEIQDLKARIEQLELSLGKIPQTTAKEEKEYSEEDLDNAVNKAFSMIDLEKRIEEEISNYLDKLR